MRRPTVEEPLIEDVGASLHATGNQTGAANV
jgi:hypothetical protein